MAGYPRKTKPNKITNIIVLIFMVLLRIILTPIFLTIRIYDWVWSMDYYNYFK